jgi:hypothetical protein
MGPLSAPNGSFGLARVFPGTGNAGDIAFSIENLTPLWCNSFLFSLIPFYRFSSVWIFGQFQSSLTQSVVMLITGPNRLSMAYWATEGSLGWPLEQTLRESLWVNLDLNRLGRKSNSFDFTVCVGHGAYGLLTKGIAAQNNQSGVSFDSSEFSQSPVSVFQGWEQSPIAGSENYVYHYQSDNGFMISDEGPDVARMRSVLPARSGLKALFSTPSVPDTFCRVAAGCAVDGRYDYLCSTILGSTEAFRELFRLWDRERFD